MRIISGEYRGFRLKTPKGDSTRPTTDRVKESVFSMIESKKHITSGARVLDLFAGSGGIGLEFLSRGAAHACFVDSDASSISVIKENIAKCRAEDSTEVYRNDAFKAIELLSRKRHKFDYIFMDPPYEKNIIPKILETIYNSGILSSNGLIIAEHEAGLEMEENVCNMAKIDSRKYGSIGVSFFTPGETSE
ncbi:ribosomal RNA small subunit methyltransferase D [Andreesenia angusta]|uniref:Ribosomal RNA small subunit methyltransferase D n=1 Tax=Andreesenia angusta TaxID=39480 RepID=A0A1S1V8D7_9FIRM|nr:16S rRNA (guanine(966)-N(2))-methyltransferase RsmD [Andreesenia angusta]OHW62660.1 ribosomal RNA small subunit methyltransferase D [Andreesenia angusta]